MIANFSGSEPRIQLTFYFDQKDRLIKSTVEDSFGLTINDHNRTCRWIATNWKNLQLKLVV